MASLAKNFGLGYDPNAKTFTLDDDRWNEMIKLTIIIFYSLLPYNTYYLTLCFLSSYVLLANQKLREFGYRPLQFEEELDNLFIRNNTTGKSAWAPTSDDPKPNEGPTPDEDYHDTHSEFMESYNTNFLS